MRPTTAHRPIPRVALAIAVVACLVVAAGADVAASPRAAASSSTAASSSAAASPSASQQAPTVEHRRTTRLALETVSRELDTSTGSWTVVVEATLSSNRLCLPVVFNCIVEPGADPAGATLTDVQCLNPWWSDLGIFSGTCLRGFGTAGHHQRFRYTYVTDPAIAPTELDLSTAFGRGVFPIVLQQIASADLQVSLTAELDLQQDCPTDTLSPGAAFSCDISVTYPLSSAPGVPVTSATLVQTLDGSTPSTVTGFSTTSPDWVCAASTCDLAPAASVDPGDRVDFTLDAVAASTPTGGDLSSAAELDFGSPTQQRSSLDSIVVAGTGDTDLAISKVSDQTTARPGQRVSWTVTVTNTGVEGSAALPATDVVLGDLAPSEISDLTVSYAAGVGTWTCAGLVCRSASMPPGVTTFTVTGTLPATLTAGTVVVNEVDVTWTNDVWGPDFPAVAGDVVEVLAASTTATTTTTVPTAVPASLAFTG